MTGPLAALSPVSMAVNLSKGKGLLGTKKKDSDRPVQSSPQSMTAYTPNGGAI